MERLKCIICNSERNHQLSTLGRFSLPTYSVMCKECGLVYNSPRLDKDEYDAFNKYIYRILNGFSEPTENYINNQKDRADQIWNYLVKSGIDMGEINSVLDVGCSSGGTLSYFKSRGINKTQGLEPHLQFSEFARSSLGLDVFTGTLEDWESSEEFDLVIMRDVLEHFLWPNKALRIVRKHIHENSIVFIETNNIAKTLYPTKKFFNVFQWCHPFIFSINSLENLLETNGFSISNVVNERYIKCIAYPKKPNSKAIYSLKKEEISSIIKIINDHDRYLFLKNIIRKVKRLIFKKN